LNLNKSNNMEKTTSTRLLTERQIKVIKANAGKINTTKLSELSGATIKCIRNYCAARKIDLCHLKKEIKEREDWEGEDGNFCIEVWGKVINRLFAIS
jgi:hypothetical protein